MRIRVVLFNLLMVGAMLFSNQVVLAASIQPSLSPKSAADNGEQPNVVYLPVIRDGNGLIATYKSGQTFLTWPERTDLNGEVYSIYRSDKPLIGTDLSTLQPIARIGKGSANFYANRFRTSTDSNATWYPRYVDRLITTDNGTQMPANWGLLVWTVSTQDFSGASSGYGYYAITVKPDGGTELYNQAVVIDPIYEAVAAPKPIEITSSTGVSIGTGGHVYIQYMDLRNWNGTYSAPNSTNLHWGYESASNYQSLLANFNNNLQYAYDYDVFVPTKDMCGGTVPDILPVFVWLHGHKLETKNREGDYPHKYCAYGIYPFDNTDTWWFGFASIDDYRASLPGAGDVVTNYTEQRVLRMIYDLERNPPGPAVDQRKIYVAGQSMGGTGAMALAQRYPNVFAASYASEPVTDMRNLQTASDNENWKADAAIKFGGSSLELKEASYAPNGWADHLKSYNGQVSVWDWENLQAGATRQYHLGNNQALFGLGMSLRDNFVWPDTQAINTFTALNSSNSPWAGWLAGKNSSYVHTWMYFNGLPTSASKAVRNETTDYTPFWKMKVLQNETVPGFSNLQSGNPEAQGGVPPSVNANGDQYYNQAVMWSASWNAFDEAPVDTSGYWKMTFCTTSLMTYGCGNSADVHVDITVRRAQNFVITPGATYHWQNYYRHNGALVSGNVNGKLEIGEGDVTANADGVLTIPQFFIRGNAGSSTIVYTGNRLVITRK